MQVMTFAGTILSFRCIGL